MHGYSRLGSGRSNGNSPASTPSPPSSPRFRHGRSKIGSGRGSPKLQSVPERVIYVLLSVVLRRRGILLFAPLMYISGMLMYMGTLDFEVPGGVAIRRRPLLGSTYHSPQVFEKLWPFMEADGNRSNVLMNAWHPKVGQSWKPCIKRSLSQAELPSSNGFLIIEANGGLNQQRISICDVVAVAKLLNATLVVPIFHLNSVWRDSSKFGDIFDEDYFIDALRKDVKVVKELPEDVLKHFDSNISNIVNLRVKAWSSSTYYLQRVLPKLLKLGAVRIAPFSNRLAHAVPSYIQGLRCLANYEALRFSEPIRTLAENMVDRMVKNSTNSGGKYVSVHLRFEEDMVAFSCCTYDGGEEEKREMDKARERSWRGKFRKPGRVIRPGAIRSDGKCPLTPLEVGMMLRGMGFDNTTTVYVAAGKIYKAERYMAPLRQMFPFLETKESIASPDELAPFQGHSSRLAALDYTVCLHSEVFVTTQGGNFPHFLMGHRRYLYRGHSKTIKPDKRKLAVLFDNPNIRWDSFKHHMEEMLHHSDEKGTELRKPNGSLYTFPMPDCMCRQAEDGFTVGNATAVEGGFAEGNATAVV
ncbi:O-fucosyltransferase 9 isoform X2 [Magnolia sinica]|uniref:O-fucosyltransferase 9 isoform X2 n=1 Tax=Magnolia sinica TaxID=86752 RepID=UPI002657F6E4|nr:O-fucosyltransferase 9 isoform X2 [Magnolia sinica]